MELLEHWEKQPEPIQPDSHHLQAAVVIYRGENTCPHSTPVTQRVGTVSAVRLRKSSMTSPNSGLPAGRVHREE